MTVELSINQIRADGGTQPRAELNGFVIADYADAMRAGAVFPPVIVFHDGTDYWLADGFHRLHAARQVGVVGIAADVHQGTCRDAVLYSVGTNAAHGLRRTNADKRRSVDKLLSDIEWRQWSNQEIARRCAVDATFVGHIREKLTIDGLESISRRGADGRIINTGNIGRRLAVAPAVEPATLMLLRDTDVADNPASLRDLARIPVDMQPRVAEVIAMTGSAVAIPRIMRTIVRSDKEQVLAASVSNIYAAARSDLASVCDLRCCSMADLLTSGIKPDCIITDPPYPAEYLPVYEELARLAVGVPLVAVMCGQTYFPQVIAAMSKHLTYRWTMAYLTPGGQAVQQWQAKVNTFWKPVLLFGAATEWIGDVVSSAVNDNDKRFHDWGQSESGMGGLVDRLSQPGQLVCDPFTGGGTTAVVALRLGRNFVGCDTDADAVLTAWQRVEADYAERA